MMPLHSINTQISSKFDDVSKFPYIGFEEGQLECPTASIPSTSCVRITYFYEGSHILQDAFPASSHHDGFLSFLPGPIPGNLHIRGYWHNPFRPGLGTSTRKGAIGSEIEFHAVLSTEINDIIHLFVDERLTHSGRDNLAQGSALSFFNYPSNERNIHPSFRFSCSNPFPL